MDLLKALTLFTRGRNFKGSAHFVLLEMNRAEWVAIVLFSGGVALFLAYVNALLPEEISFPTAVLFWGATILGGLASLIAAEVFVFRLLRLKKDYGLWLSFIVVLVASPLFTLYDSFLEPHFSLPTDLFYDELTQSYRLNLLDFTQNGLVSFLPLLLFYMALTTWEKRLHRSLDEVEKPFVEGGETKKGPIEQEMPLPLFMSRLNPNMGHELLALMAQGHYVTVYTRQGEEMILYRFKDALDELNQTPDWTPGRQIHRSYWVATDAIESVKKEGRQFHLVLKNKMECPVSRTFQTEVKAAGMLDRRDD